MEIFLLYLTKMNFSFAISIVNICSYFFKKKTNYTIKRTNFLFVIIKLKRNRYKFIINVIINSIHTWKNTLLMPDQNIIDR